MFFHQLSTTCSTGDPRPSSPSSPSIALLKRCTLRLHKHKRSEKEVKGVLNGLLRTSMFPRSPADVMQNTRNPNPQFTFDLGMNLVWSRTGFKAVTASVSFKRWEERRRSLLSLVGQRQLSCLLSTQDTTLYICSLLKRSFVKADIFCPYQRFPQYPAPRSHSEFMVFHLFVCLCINLFWQCVPL